MGGEGDGAGGQKRGGEDLLSFVLLPFMEGWGGEGRGIGKGGWVGFLFFFLYPFLPLLYAMVCYS